MRARDVIEAEDPKRFLRQIARVPVWNWTGLWLRTSDGKLNHMLGNVFFHGAANGDNKWHMRDVVGEPNMVACAQAFATEKEAKAALVAWIVRKGLIRSSDEVRNLHWRRDAAGAYEEYLEAEDPKGFLKHHVADMDIKAFLAKIALDDTPHEDSFKSGQRVQRTKHNPFGARPFGGEPNDIGDLGTIIAFHGRKDEPYHALYTVRWDRHPIGSEYCDHTNVAPAG